MTDNEIIKALEACKEKNHLVCNVCPLGRSGDCVERLARNALWLINRQKAEIDKLKVQNAKLQKYFTIEFDEKKLEESVEIAVDEVIRVSLNEVRVKAIREFAENLKLKADKESVRELVNYGNYWGRTMKIPEDIKGYAISYKISEVDLDNLVKEMEVEDDK